MELAGLLREYAQVMGTVILITLALYPFELAFPIQQNQPLSKRVSNLVYAVAFFAIVVFILHPIFRWTVPHVLTAVRGGLIAQLGIQGSGILYQVSFAIVFAVVWDVLIYGVHRLQHVVPWLWDTHRFHHSDSSVNSTTQTRQHVIQYVLVMITYVPLLIIFGAQTPHYIAIFVIFRFWGFLTHANVRLNLGLLTPVIAGPQWHRIHHSADRIHYDRNFAVFFPFIDIAFGTYYRPQKGEYPACGLPPEEAMPELKEATVAPFAYWYKAIARRFRRPAAELVQQKVES